jgi:SagB-type dehydrogenase family enzyme
MSSPRKPLRRRRPEQGEAPSSRIGREFMLKTRYPYLQVSDQRRGLPQPSLQLPVEPDDVRVELPPPKDVDLGAIDVRIAIEHRVSVRRYADAPLSLEELSYLLWCTQGVKRVVSGRATMRTVPSAGARHALETYLSVHRVRGLEAGLYRFLPIEHQLVQIRTGAEVADEVTGACLGQGMVTASAMTFIWVAVAYRMTWRYVERGYRYLHLDAGHVCQNLYLAAESIDCGVCAIAAFSDEAMNETLGLDGEDLFAIYVAALGKKP